MNLIFISRSGIYGTPLTCKNANIPAKLAAGHKYEPAAFSVEGEVELRQFQEISFRPRALRVNLSLTQFKFQLSCHTYLCQVLVVSPASRPDVCFLFKSHLSGGDDRE